VHIKPQILPGFNTGRTLHPLGHQTKGRAYESIEKNMDLNEQHQKHRDENWPLAHWRAWGSWFSWGSPIGLGLFFVEIGACIWLLHLAGLVG
jgi:hypothetical protein